jgi:predicted DNA-binding transcriptional regulator YafY
MTNLVLVLLETNRPLTLREIAASVAGYPTDRSSARQAFERDKRALRDLGIPLSVEQVESDDQLGYRIHPDEYYLPELNLEPGDEQALAFAIAAVQLGGSAGWDALAKLGGPVSEAAYGRAELTRLAIAPEFAPVAVLPSLPQLGPIHGALRSRAVLRFAYHGRQRQVEPYGLTFRGAAWYLVGRDLTTAGGPALRTFRVDRLESEPSMGEPGSFELPPGFDLRGQIRLLPWDASGAEADVPIARLEVDARLARQVTTQVGAEAVVAGDDGGIMVRLPAGDEQAFVSWVVGLGDTAVVSGPPELRQAVVARLRELGAPAGEEGAPAAGVAHKAARDEAAPHAPAPGGGGRGRIGAKRPAATGNIVAGERLRRLLAILAHLARVGEAEISEVATRFSMSEGELVGELELAACCGLPPYTPDQLIELIVDGERVTAQQLKEFGRPRRFTPDEGFVLAAAARALISVPGADEDGSLASALSKLEAALGSARLAVDLDQPEHLPVLQSAVRAHERVELNYFSSSAQAPSTRHVDPYQVVLREGLWYLDGWCHLAGGLRRFQADRVQGVRLLGEHFQRREELAAELARPGAYLGSPDALEARIILPAASELVVEQVATGPTVPAGEGMLAASVLVSDEGWFGRLLLRLGPGTTVESPPELRDAGRMMARRALRRYEEELSETH